MKDELLEKYAATCIQAAESYSEMALKAFTLEPTRKTFLEKTDTSNPDVAKVLSYFAGLIVKYPKTSPAMVFGMAYKVSYLFPNLTEAERVPFQNLAGGIFFVRLLKKDLDQNVIQHFQTLRQALNDPAIERKLTPVQLTILETQMFNLAPLGPSGNPPAQSPAD